MCLVLVALVATTLVATLAARSANGGLGQLSLGPAETVAPGVELYRLADPQLLTPPGPVAAQLLRADPRRVRFRVVLAGDKVIGSETVPDMARRTGALAAINGGFFLPSGEPAGLFKIDGELVSEAPRQRGAIGFLPPGTWRRRGTLLFDQVDVTVTIEVRRGHEWQAQPIDAVDTTRLPGAVVLFTPRFAADTGTAGGGTEWVLRGRPLRVVEQRESTGPSPIPSDGFVVSAGPTTAPATWPALRPGDEVRVKAVYRPRNGTSPADWSRAQHIVGGVGLLVNRGRVVTDWSPERPREGFATERHPRTMIGVARDGGVWMVTVDGRQPALSLGMSFAELQGLARRVNLVEALNLDGGGSTTMVVGGRVVNHPSDPTGPRRVSDAVLVLGPGGPSR